MECFILIQKSDKDKLLSVFNYDCFNGVVFGFKYIGLELKSDYYKVYFDYLGHHSYMANDAFSLGLLIGAK
jgi:hypothetical protein